MPAVEQVDAELVVVDWLYDSAATIPDLADWKFGTVVEANTTPTNYVQVRLIGGLPEQAVADRPRLDLRLWGDGTYATEDAVKRAARAVIARMRRDLRAVVVMSPIPLPDPADQAKTHVMCTVELLTRGTQV